MNSFKEFFSFSKKELNGLLVFCILLVLIAIAPTIYTLLNPPKVYDFSAFQKEVESFRASARKKQFFKYRSSHEDEIEPGIAAATLFHFNPNNLPVSQWNKLGLSDKQIKVIKNYEAKGGKFFKKEDLKKIYSIKPDDYARLEPFIDIPEKSNAFKPRFEKDQRKPELRKALIIDLNTADSVQLESLSGVGPAFASRIIKYRNRLGGFCRKEQLKEVYGLDSVLYEKMLSQISVSQTSIKQIPVNSATFDDFKKHPYLTYKQMNAIIKYRKQHGYYKSIEDLKSVAILNDQVLNKLAPYLSFNTR